MDITPVKELFSQMTAQYQAKLSQEDYDTLVETAYEFAQQLLPLNYLANIVNSGWNIRFWIQQVNGEGKIFWEADDLVESMHVESASTGCSNAQEAFAELINAVIFERQRIIREKSASLGIN